MSKINYNKLKRKTVNIDQLLFNEFNNPFIGKSQNLIDSYVSDARHFEYYDFPIVVRYDEGKANFEDQYLVLTNVHEVETAKLLGSKSLNVVEIVDEAFTQDDAFRFAMHRNAFMDLSYESRYYAIKETFARLEKNKEWSQSIKTSDNKIWNKVAQVLHTSVGTISKCVILGDQDIQILKDCDLGIRSIEREYKKLRPGKPSFIESDGEEIPTERPTTRVRPYKNRQSGSVGRDLSHTATIPTSELHLEVNMVEDETSIISGCFHSIIKLNGEMLEGYTPSANDAGNGFTQLRFKSDKEPMELIMIVPDMREFFRSKGFRPESPRRKLQINSRVPDIDKGELIQLAIKAMVKLGFAKTKTETAVHQAMFDNTSITEVGQLITRAVQIAQTL